MSTWMADHEARLRHGATQYHAPGVCPPGDWRGLSRGNLQEPARRPRSPKVTFELTDEHWARIENGAGALKSCTRPFIVLCFLFSETFGRANCPTCRSGSGCSATAMPSERDSPSATSAPVQPVYGTPGWLVSLVLGSTKRVGPLLRPLDRPACGGTSVHVCALRHQSQSPSTVVAGPFPSGSPSDP